MRPIAIGLMVAGAAGVVGTFVYAAMGDTSMAMRMVGAASAAIVLSLVLFNRGQP